MIKSDFIDSLLWRPRMFAANVDMLEGMFFGALGGYHALDWQEFLRARFNHPNSNEGLILSQFEQDREKAAAIFKEFQKQINLQEQVLAIWRLLPKDREFVLNGICKFCFERNDPPCTCQRDE